jgi:hypothetical protein
VPVLVVAVREERMTYGRDNPLREAYLVLKKAGEFVFPHGKLKGGFWIGSDYFVTRGHGTRGRFTLFVEYWEGKTKASAMKIVRKLKKAGFEAYVGNPYAL